jgi:hypothetical protein
MLMACVPGARPVHPQRWTSNPQISDGTADERSADDATYLGGVGAPGSGFLADVILSSRFD